MSTAANHHPLASQLGGLAAVVVEQTKALTAYLETKEQGTSKTYLAGLMDRTADLTALKVALEFDLFSIIPPQEPIELSDLAQPAGMDAIRAGQCLRLLTTLHIFRESQPRWFTHTHLSLTVRDEEGVRNLMISGLGEIWEAACATPACIKDSPDAASDSTRNPFHTRFGIPIFEYCAQNPQRGAQFARSMTGLREVESRGDELGDGFPWHKVQGTVVDVGGGSGHVSIMLAQLQCHARAGPLLVRNQNQKNPDLAGRMSFTQADFFSPQPYRNAAAFLLRHITHNWCDRDVVRIFRALVPGLEGSAPGTPLLINDPILPDTETQTLRQERFVRQLDMFVLIMYGGRQRTVREFDALLREADSRYEIRAVHGEGGFGVVEVCLNHEE